MFYVGTNTEENYWGGLQLYTCDEDGNNTYEFLDEWDRVTSYIEVWF